MLQEYRCIVAVSRVRLLLRFLDFHEKPPGNFLRLTCRGGSQRGLLRR
jgi:hypothetical protein